MKKRKTRVAPSARRSDDWHHFLFQRRHWQQGYAKALREHPYMGKYIPRDTLHREIHSKIHDIPTPNGSECKLAFEELIKREREGTIDVERDSCARRLNFLIELWREKCPATVAILEWQRDVIAKFYKSG